MDRRVYPILIAAVLIIAGCSSIDINPYLEEGYRLSGLEAASVYERGLEHSDSEKLYYNLAYSYIEAEEYEKAIRTADEALEEYPDMLRFIYLKAYAYRCMKMMASYERTLLTILEKDPGNNDIRGILAGYYQDIGLDGKARELAMEIIRRDPDDPEALSIMADYSEFYDSIDSDEEKSEDFSKRPWSVPPSFYDPAGILRGEGLIDWT